MNNFFSNIVNGKIMCVQTLLSQELFDHRIRIIMMNYIYPSN